MKWFQPYCLSLLFLFVAALSNAQQERAYSARSGVFAQQGDTATISRLIRTANQYAGERDPKALAYADSAFQLAVASRNAWYAGRAIGMRGVAEMFVGKPEKAIADLQNSLYISKRVGDTRQFIRMNNAVATCFVYLNRYPESIDYYQRCLDILEASPDDKMKISVLQNMGGLYTEIGDSVKAMGLFEEAAAIPDPPGGKVDRVSSFLSLSQIYTAQGKYDKAMAMAKRIMAAAKASGSLYDRSCGLYALAAVYHQSGISYPLALKYYHEYLALTQQMGDEDGMLSGISSLGAYYLTTRDYRQAVKFSQQALAMAARMGNKDYMVKAFVQLSDAYRALGNYKAADVAYRRSVSLFDSINGEMKQKDIARQEMRHDIGKKRITDSLRHREAENQLASRLKQQQTMFYTISAFVILIIILFVLFYRIRQIRKEADIKLSFNKKVAEVEMQALRAQMNPHFIFNCLNSINRYIVKSDHETASTYLTRFAKLIRLILDNAAQQTASLDSELKLLQLYIEIESLRFNNRFSWNIEVDEALSAETIFIPSMVIQPYVENAIWHGLMHKKEKGLLVLKISRHGNDLLKVVVEDDGVGRKASEALHSKDTLKTKSYGMQITRDRLQIVNQLFNTEAEVRIEDLYTEAGEAAGTRVTLHLPCEQIAAAAVISN